MSLTTISVGADVAWSWVAPEAIDSSVQPTATFYGGEAVLLGPVALEAVVDDVGVESCSVDRRTLTLASLDALTEVSAQRVAGGSYSGAFLITPDAGVFPIRVIDIDLVGGDGSGVLMTLAEPLPRKVDPAGGTVQFASWVTDLSSADVTASPRRDVVVEVSYTSLGVAGIDGSEKTSRVRLIVERASFSTGLTSSIFGDIYPELVQSTHRRDQDQSGVIKAALDELRRMVQPHARAKGYGVDLIDGAALQVIHADLVAARLYERTEPEYSERIRERVAEDIKSALEVVWSDLDGDSRIDDGEGTTQLAGVVSLSVSTLSSTFNGYIPDRLAPAWTRNRW